MGEQTDKKTNHWDGNTSSIIIIIIKIYRKKLLIFGVVTIITGETRSIILIIKI